MKCEFIINDGHDQTIWSIDWHPNGRMFASCSSDRCVKIWSCDFERSLCECQFKLESSHSRTIRRVRWSWCGRRLATCSFDSSAVVWKLNEDGTDYDEVGQLDGHNNEVKQHLRSLLLLLTSSNDDVPKSIAWSRSGEYIATCSRDKTVWIWQVMDDEYELCEVLQGHSQDVKDVVWSPTEDILASCSYDCSIRLYKDDGDSWFCFNQLDGHTSTVWSIAFNANGDKLASSSSDCSIIIWCTANHTTWIMSSQLNLNTELPIYSVSWNNKTDFIACGCGDDSIRLLKLNTKVELEEVEKEERAHSADVMMVDEEALESEQPSALNVPNHRQMHHNQLQAYRISHQESILTSDTGCPLQELTASLTASPFGQILLQDSVLIERLANFNREKPIPRVCFARGAGAYGYFECTDSSCFEFTKASLFQTTVTTPVTVRFSHFHGEQGFPDTKRDLLGMSVKFFTECGVWDLVASSLPVFYIKDPLDFVSLCRSQGRNPVTGLYDPNMKWDFIVSRPESLHLICMLYTQRGLPLGYQHSDYYSVNTFKMLNHSGQSCYCRFKWSSASKGTRFMDEQSVAMNMESQCPKYYVKELFNSICAGRFPTFDLSVQLLNNDINVLGFDPFDCTRVWPHAQCPLRKIGTLTLNRVVANNHTEVEQLCYSPGNLIPGIEPSPDKILQARILAHPDAQRYRVGVNFNQLPCNRSISKVSSLSRGGQMCLYGNGGTPAYTPNSFHGPNYGQMKTIHRPHHEFLNVHCQRYLDKEDNLDQVKAFYTMVLSKKQRKLLALNLASDIVNVHEIVKKRLFYLLEKISVDLLNDVQCVTSE
ncbi:hypothetical protein ACOME3_005774 [Neoechinorhynchus agilis]